MVKQVPPDHDFSSWTVIVEPQPDLRTIKAPLPPWPMGTGPTATVKKPPRGPRNGVAKRSPPKKNFKWQRSSCKPTTAAASR